MHGVKRSQLPPKDASGGGETGSGPGEKAADEGRIVAYRRQCERMVALRQRPADRPPFASYGEALEALTLTADILGANADFVSAYNLRRQALRFVVAQAPAAESLERLIASEVDFGIVAIRASPKGYGPWYHRRWLVTFVAALTSDPSPVLPAGLLVLLVRGELALCTKLLAMDDRNFHCWNYRSFLAEAFSSLTSGPRTDKAPIIAVRDEFDFTTAMIYKNFSNYSAWHRRSLLLGLLFGGKAAASDGEDGGSAELESVVSADFKLVQSAYFTEPSDQSCWFYLRFLVAFLATQPSIAAASYDRMLDEQLAAISQLLAIEPSAALALGTWVHLALLRRDRRGHGRAEAAAEEDEEIAGRLATLAAVDGLRRGMYAEMRGRLTSRTSG